MGNKRDRIGLITTLGFTTAVTVVTLFYALVNNYADPEDVGINGTAGDTSDLFFTQITPADWAFGLWLLIFIWQGAWIIYGWSLTFRANFPSTISNKAMIYYSVACLSIVVWICLWGNRQTNYSFPVFVISAITLYVAIGFESIYLFKITGILKKRRKYKVDLYLTRFLVLNGLVFFATWLTALVFVNFTVVLQYYGELGAKNAGTISLFFMILLLLVYFILDLTKLDPFLRYVVAVYPAVIWAASAIIDAQWSRSEDKRNSALAIVILLFGIIMLVVKLLSMLLFLFVRPIKYADELFTGPFKLPIDLNKIPIPDFI